PARCRTAPRGAPRPRRRRRPAATAARRARPPPPRRSGAAPRTCGRTWTSQPRPPLGGYAFRGRAVNALSGEEALGHEKDVRGPPGAPPHVPGDPVGAVADEHAQGPALAKEPLLLGALDAVEEMELAGLPAERSAVGLDRDRVEEPPVVRPEDDAA